MTERTSWQETPIMGGLRMLTAEWQMRERPAKGLNPVATHATATVVPDFDWEAHGVLWGVKFHRYVPRRPLEKREKRNKRTGTTEWVSPPPIIPEYTVNGRVSVNDGDLAGALDEATHKCEEIIRAGRPAGAEL